MKTIICFFTYFILYSFAGWVLESVYKTLAQKKFVNSGFLNGPLCPIYGFGAIIMILSLNFLKERPLLLFVAAFFILSVWEYIVGILLEKIFKTKYWDYSYLKYNFQGRVCLKNSIYWGILGVIFICLVHPIVEKLINMVDINMLFYANIAIAILTLIDLIISVIAVTNFENMVKNINDMGIAIKELKDKSKEKIVTIEKNTIENAESKIKELKIAQAKLKLRIYRQANRLKKAFPSMKSETITKFLNQKIDLKRLKENIKKKNKE